MLPNTGEIVMRWLPYLGIALILIGVGFYLYKRKKDKENDEK